MSNTVIMHVNFAEFPRAGEFDGKSIDDICRMAAELGYEGVEFRSRLPGCLGNATSEDYYRQIAEGKKKYGLKEILLGVVVADCMNPDKEVRAEAVKTAIKKAQLISDLCGTTVCNTNAVPIRSTDTSIDPRAFEFHGSAAATEEMWNLTVDTYQQIGKGLEPLGVKFAFETHMRYIHDLPEPSRKLVDLIDSPMIGINMDYGNTAYFPKKPTVTETIDIYGDKLFYAHLKNSVNKQGCALAEGEINHRVYLKKLRDVGFSGPIAIEAPRPGDRTWFAQQDLAYYKAVVASI